MVPGVCKWAFRFSMWPTFGLFIKLLLVCSFSFCHHPIYYWLIRNHYWSSQHYQSHAHYITILYVWLITCSLSGASSTCDCFPSTPFKSIYVQQILFVVVVTSRLFFGLQFVISEPLAQSQSKKANLKRNSSDAPQVVIDVYGSSATVLYFLPNLPLSYSHTHPATYSNNHVFFGTKEGELIKQIFSLLVARTWTNPSNKVYDFSKLMSHSNLGNMTLHNVNHKRCSNVANQYTGQLSVNLALIGLLYQWDRVYHCTPMKIMHLSFSAIFQVIQYFFFLLFTV